MPRSLARAGLALAAYVAVSSPGVAHATPPASNSFVVTDVRVFDGRREIPRATVVVRHGRITAVGPHVPTPPNLPVIDGEGHTLLPGFIDGHAHSRDRSELERSAQFGVTTVFDMWSLPDYIQTMTTEQQEGLATDRADIFSAGSPATLPEGYPYVFTPEEIEEPTLSTPEEAASFVAARFAEGSNHLKLMVEDLEPLVLPFPIPTLDRDVIRALVRASHRHHRLAVAHATQQEHAQVLVDEGIDGLVHVFVDEPISPALLAEIVRRRVFVVPTLNAEEGFIGTAGGEALIADPEIGPYLTELEIFALTFPPPPSNITAEHLAIAADNVGALRAAGVPLLAGTDVFTLGVSLHRDLELLVDAGLSPTEALTAATSAGAKAFGFRDRGSIAPGKRADLLLVEGDPTENILATRAIRHVWKQGVEVERPLPALFSTATQSPATGPSLQVCGHGH